VDRAFSFDPAWRTQPLVPGMRLIESIDSLHICKLACWSVNLYPSILGMASSHVSTFVSRTLLTSIIQQQLTFRNERLVWNPLHILNDRKRLFGISNGVEIDAQDKNPFRSKTLAHHQCQIPLNANLYRKIFHQDPPTHVQDTDQSLPLTHGKQRAKEILSTKYHLLPPTAAHRPLALFIGRLSVDKGIDIITESIEHLRLTFLNSSVTGLTILLMGQASDFRMDILRKFERRRYDRPMDQARSWTFFFDHTQSDSHEYPTTHRHDEHVNNMKNHKTDGDVVDLVVWEGESIQRRWGILARLAADIVLVPSKTESFGLVAAEGLLFGSVVVSSGVGGLQEFLRSRTRHCRRILLDNPSAHKGDVDQKVQKRDKKQNANHGKLWKQDMEQDPSHDMAQDAAPEKEDNDVGDKQNTDQGNVENNARTSEAPSKKEKMSLDHCSVSDYVDMGNAFLFDLNPDGPVEFAKMLTRATKELLRLQQSTSGSKVLERFRWRLVADAMALGWQKVDLTATDRGLVLNERLDESVSPIVQYIRAYNTALMDVFRQ
jgi:glycosyltransferase involved in cell wall biosynthesis